MKIAVIAGEKSGDNYGSLLIESLKKIKPDVSIIGTGGEGIREKADLFIEGIPSGQMGFSGVVRRLPLFYRSFQKVRGIINRETPDLIVFIDNPGFNLKLAEVLGKKFPCYYYIPPKIWVHNYKRIRIIKKYIKAVITIFPFEQMIYQKEGIPAFWFGHPVIDLVKQCGPQDNQYDCPVIGLLPGSREEEIRYLLPEFIHIVKGISEKRKVKVILSASDRKIKKIEEDIIRKYQSNMEIFEGFPHPVIQKADIVLAASGTVNLEVALYGKPMIVFYKTTYLNYILARLMVKLDMISPVNLIAGGKVIPEYIQNFSYRRIEEDINNILEKGHLYEKEQRVFTRIKDMMGSGSVSEKVAEFLIRGIYKDGERDT